MRRAAIGTRGGVLNELAIVLPFLLLGTAGLVNLGSAYWQVQLFADATRHGARRAASMMDDGVTCTEVVTEAQTSFNDFITSQGDTMGVNLPTHWQPPEVCEEIRNWDGLNGQRFIRVRANTLAVANCVFCFGGTLNYIPMSVSATWPANWVCAGTLPAC